MLTSNFRMLVLNAFTYGEVLLDLLLEITQVIIGLEMWKILVINVVLLAGISSASTPPEKCERRWKKIGCFHDRIIPDRPLPYEILNHRDPINTNWDGHLINWARSEWPQSLHALACRCAELTRMRGHRFFGLQFFGECWTGPSHVYYRDGKSEKCVGVDYQKCDDKSETECVGKAFTNYIYDLEAVSKTPTDGSWGEWSTWSGCDRTCGGGQKIRERICNNPSPAHGGESCEGEAEDITTCNEQKCEPVCKKKLEIGVITDASTSVTSANYKKVKSFVKKLTDEFEIGGDKVRFGMIHFSWEAHLDFTMRDQQYWDPVALKTKIDKSPYIYGGTSTDKALYMAENEFFCDGCTRPTIPKVLVVITDGKSSITSDPMKIATKGLKEKGVTIISIGIGKKVDEMELIEIASDAQHMFYVDYFEHLMDKLNDVLKQACNAVLI